MVIKSHGDYREEMARTNGGTKSSADKKTSSSASSYAIHEKPIGSTKHVRVVIIGAGASGLNMIRALRLSLRDHEVVVYEKNEGVGGTWFENQYPGCRCDIPSHNYQFSWRPKKDWSNFFAPAEEIRDYLNEVCDEEHMRDSIKTSHQVEEAVWREDQGKWMLKVTDLQAGTQFEDTADFLLNGSGILK
jgi:cation diffusion facilitator CzcD-associated flavoprotein CzcO